MDRLKASTVDASIYAIDQTVRCRKGLLSSGYCPQEKVNRLPLSVLTDRWLSTPVGSEQSRAALEQCLIAARN